MATTQQGSKDGSKDGQSGFDKLLGELGNFVSAQAEDLADKAVDKVGDLTDRLSDVAENGGSLAGIGGRLLEGDSPVKAVLGQTVSGLKDKVSETAGNLFGGKSKGKGRKGGTKAMHIMETMDVGLPLRTVYDHWTQYENFSSFTKGVRSVSRNDGTTSDWKVKVGPSTRSWKATVQEQVPDDRIVWSSEGAKGTSRGCVSFHELAPSLTRIVLVVEYYPAGFFEKTGNIWRAQGRRMRLDLKNFNRFVSLSNDEPEGWRGEIQDGEVVVTHEEALEEEEAAAEEPEEGEEEGEEAGAAEEDAYPEGEEEADQDADEDEDAYADEEEYGGEEEEEGEEGDEPDEGGDAYEDEVEDEGEDEEEEAPPRRSRRRTRARA
ncbi:MULTISPECIES: SRPBCC family protein [unclassified Streptomyces]|uniref:SRPBCC family protein n=1 Tax=unclassified Streptomyces TaxID=2593676 RepID=UPI0006AD9B10|nr:MULTISPECIES: SRPBCC family protein [unclassified Streptomyces]KOU15370.1 cyclase [Streptomyces sp. WM6349]KOV42241.1 cyclase [Streptomyces sp. H036]